MNNILELGSAAAQSSYDRPIMAVADFRNRLTIAGTIVPDPAARGRFSKYSVLWYPK